MDATVTHDRLDRRKRTVRSSTGKRVTPQARDVVWFQKLYEHGPLSSSFLHAYTRSFRTCEKRAKDRLTDLFNEANTPHGGPYLSRPRQQFDRIDARYRDLVYDLEPAALAAMIEQTLLSGQPRSHYGAWWHNHLVASVTASIELAAISDPSVAFIPQHKILDRAGTTLRCPVTISEPGSNRVRTIELIPDALFGLEYQTEKGPRYRFFAVEVDRGTEPCITSNWNRKSYLRSLLQYEQYVASFLYREHLKLTAPLLVLNVFTSKVAMARMMKLVEDRFPNLASVMLFAHYSDQALGKPDDWLLHGVWERADTEGVIIGHS